MASHCNSFLETIIAFLMPYFIAASKDKQEARSEILDTLAAYETRTRAEMLQAAHIIAFGMTTLDVLAEAKTAEMSQSMRLRYRSCANSLNRSTLQTEKALDQRLGDEIPDAAPAEMAEPIDDMREAEIMAVIQQAKATINSQRPRANPANGPKLPTDQTWDPQLWASAMINRCSSTLPPLNLPPRPPALSAARQKTSPLHRTDPAARKTSRRSLHRPSLIRFKPI